MDTHEQTRREFLKKAGWGAASLGVWQLSAGLLNAGEKRESGHTTCLYNEKYRPQFHFTPKQNWTNDPNGLVYYKGEYHMFFQHNPTGINWGNMTWAHAVSTDLIHWKQLANAIKPDDLGTIFSGSAVVDWNNTSGLQTGKENVLIAFYTSAGEFASVEKPYTQSIAYSNDRGKTWVKYKDNPIIGHIRGANSDFMLLWSKNLRDWKQLQKLTLPDSSECPDFFELAVDGDPADTRWVFWGANGRYLLGTFDGHKFTPESGSYESRVGNFYAAQTWSDIPKSDGRRIQIGWMAGGEFPGMPFNQQMSIPCELTLRRFSEGIRLCLVPFREIAKLRDAEYSWKDIDLKPGKNLLSEISAGLLEIQCEIELSRTGWFGFRLRGARLAYNAKEQMLRCKRRKVKLAPIDGRLKLHILVDRTSIEVFGNDGRMSMFVCSPLDTDNKSVKIFTYGGDAKLRSLNLWKLRSIWRES
ncbi:MAG: glycoside hydrolase family 32 protein [Planctomycetota bacterium]|jgi:sucrose-6-phosphate hydrolase SacC (GH32 family)